MGKILGRYILREVVTAWIVVMGVLLIILLANQVAAVLERAAAGQFPQGVVLELIYLGMLQYLSILVPFGLLLGIVLALGRLYHDSELAAAFACGVRPATLYGGVIALGVVLAVGLAALTLQVAPGATAQALGIRDAAVRAGQFAPLQAGTFRSFAGGTAVVYAERVDRDGTLQNVFVERNQGSTVEVTLAQRAVQTVTPDAEYPDDRAVQWAAFRGRSRQHAISLHALIRRTLHSRAAAARDRGRDRPGRQAHRGASRLRGSQEPGEAAVADLDATDVHRAHGAGHSAGTPEAAPGSLRTRLGRARGLIVYWNSDFRRPGLDRARRHPRRRRPVVGACRAPVARRGGDLRAPGLATPALSPGGARMNILDRYILRTVLGAVALVLIVLLVLGGLFVFISQQGDIGVGHYTVADALWYTLLNLPQQVYQLLPITALIGSVIGFGQLARGSEITVIRATGVSVARLAGSALIAAAVLIAFEVAVGNSSRRSCRRRRIRQKAFSQFNSVGFGGGTGAWVRDGDLILNVAPPVRLTAVRRDAGVSALTATHAGVHRPCRERDGRGAPHVASRRLYGVALHR